MGYFSEPEFFNPEPSTQPFELSAFEAGALEAR
jgi:hypothetical protein